MTILKQEGDGVVGKRLVYVARKVIEPRLVAESGRHHGLQGALYDAEAYVDVAVEL